MTHNETTILDLVLTWDNPNEAIAYLINKYAEQSIHNAEVLIDTIPRVANTAMEHINRKMQSYREASFWLMAQLKMDKAEKSQYFATMAPVCMAVFPNGLTEAATPAQKAYWNEFAALLKDPKAFSWKEDGSWAKQFGYADYLRMVEQQIGR